MDLASDAVVLLDERGTVRGLNAAAGRLFACDPTAVVGKAVGALIPGFAPALDGDAEREVTARRANKGKIEGAGAAKSGGPIPRSSSSMSASNSRS